MAQRHEIPTHLAVEDRVLSGLTMPQLLVLLCGLCASYALWQGSPAALAPLRPALAGSVLAGGIALALWRPQGRGLLTWTLVVSRYLLLPRLYLWRPCHAATMDTGADEHWLKGVPRLAWACTGAPPTRKGRMP
jgi:hypothetical protein